tara:strand:- start:228 stop:500 length:273 start_codon:yes stop_codon:yes gene_type:complete
MRSRILRSGSLVEGIREQVGDTLNSAFLIGRCLNNRTLVSVAIGSRTIVTYIMKRRIGSWFSAIAVSSDSYLKPARDGVMIVINLIRDGK